jgi:hypothetical protein
MLLYAKLYPETMILGSRFQNYCKVNKQIAKRCGKSMKTHRHPPVPGFKQMEPYLKAKVAKTFRIATCLHYSYR